MQNTSDRIYFNFSYYALNLLGKGLYSNAWSAISELVANGLDAQASSVKLFINMCDKRHATIEIFDNGVGMSYEDLAEKYVFMGKNKREDTSIDENIRNSYMGRKGIGKLSALFLSKKYFLVTKSSKSPESSWFLDTKNANDADIPSLQHCDINDVCIEAHEEWNKFKTGTLIKLTDVDLTGIGIQTLEGLKARLADFFLTDFLQGKISICILSNPKDPILFQEVHKVIAFKNMYAFFDSTNKDIYKKLAKDVVVAKAKFPEVAQKKREVIHLNPKEFPNITGKKEFLLKDGVTRIAVPYKLDGWIGVHTSIDEKSANYNDELFMKNRAYRPTQLRLYVRKKLAVENFLDLMGRTQATDNYIEGEISFDILDDDRFHDIATTNRQSVIKNDERVQFLIELLNPIITKLITERNKLGKMVKDEDDAIEKKQKDELERLRFEAEEQALQEKDAKERAERKAQEAQKEKEIVEANLNAEIRRANFLEKLTEPDKRLDALITHIIKQLAGGIEKDVNSIISSYYENPDNIEKIELVEVLEATSFDMALMKQASKISLTANFNLKQNKVKTDLFAFIEDYINKVAKKNIKNGLTINFINTEHFSYTFAFSPFEICLFIVNILDNADKYRAKNIDIICEKTRLIFKNDGDDLKPGIEKETFFKQGFTTSEDGSGLGLYHCNTIAKNMQANLDIQNNDNKGVKIILELPNEN